MTCISACSTAREIVSTVAIGFVVVIGAVAVYATSTDYEYAYNGRTLGIVKEQKDVLEILDLVSDALSQEYGSNIVIDPETDMTFTPVLKFGKQIDDPDTVLRRFTYMGDIQAEAYAIVVDGNAHGDRRERKDRAGCAGYHFRHLHQGLAERL